MPSFVIVVVAEGVAGFVVTAAYNFWLILACYVAWYLGDMLCMPVVSIMLCTLESSMLRLNGM